MIRQIDNSDVSGAAQQATGNVQGTHVPPATTAGKTFASVLAHQKAAAPHKDPIKTPQGEVWRPVPGHDHYAKITEGPRAGQYINLSRGARRGQVFSIEVRDGKKVHVYDKGTANELVVGAAKDSGHVKGPLHLTAAQRRPKGETWAPVKGVSNYADILSGPRNGLFVNTSGGVRDGMAFQIVKHGDKVFHVYGKGKHRQVVEVNSPPPKKSSHPQDSNGQSGTTGTSATSQTTGPTGDATGGASADS